MAINKITAGLADGPSVFATPVINQLAALLTLSGEAKRYADGYIMKGALFNIGGTMYMADSDTAISGSASDYIAITASGDIATASYVSSLSGVSWDGAYNGWFDASGTLYIFDEVLAKDNGDISEIYNQNLSINTLLKGLKGTYGTFTAGSRSSPYIIPAGLYMLASSKLVFDQYGNWYYISLRILNDSNEWEGDGSCDGLIISDGIHFGISYYNSDFKTVYYRKLL